MTNTEALREQFEAWARKNELEAERHKYADDQYNDHAATYAWWAWRDALQTGYAAAKAETADPVVGRWYFVTNDGAVAAERERAAIVVDAKIGSVRKANLGHGGRVNSAVKFALDALRDCEDAIRAVAKEPSDG